MNPDFELEGYHFWDWIRFYDILIDNEHKFPLLQSLGVETIISVFNNIFESNNEVFNFGRNTVNIEQVTSIIQTFRNGVLYIFDQTSDVEVIQGSIKSVLTLSRNWEYSLSTSFKQALLDILRKHKYPSLRSLLLPFLCETKNDNRMLIWSKYLVECLNDDITSWDEFLNIQDRPGRTLSFQISVWKLLPNYIADLNDLELHDLIVNLALCGPIKDEQIENNIKIMELASHVEKAALILLDNSRNLPWGTVLSLTVFNSSSVSNAAKKWLLRYTNTLSLQPAIEFLLNENPKFFKTFFSITSNVRNSLDHRLWLPHAANYVLDLLDSVSVVLAKNMTAWKDNFQRLWIFSFLICQDILRLADLWKNENGIRSDDISRLVAKSTQVFVKYIGYCNIIIRFTRPPVDGGFKTLINHVQNTTMVALKPWMTSHNLEINNSCYSLIHAIFSSIRLEGFSIINSVENELKFALDKNMIIDSKLRELLNISLKRPNDSIQPVGKYPRLELPAQGIQEALRQTGPSISSQQNDFFGRRKDARVSSTLAVEKLSQKNGANIQLPERQPHSALFSSKKTSKKSEVVTDREDIFGKLKAELTKPRTAHNITQDQTKRDIFTDDVVIPERRSVKALQIQNPRTKTTEVELETGRSKPVTKLSHFFDQILTWEVSDRNEFIESTPSGIADSFEDAQKYVETFRPLLTLETKAQFIQECENVYSRPLLFVTLETIATVNHLHGNIP